jgi:hypothetical protein
MRWIRTCVVALTCAACGGPSPAQSAEDAAPAEAPSDESATEAPTADSAESGDGNDGGSSESSSAGGEPASPADVKEALQLVLDDEALAPYLHLEQPDRFPLRVATRNLPPGIELEKATKPVILVDDPDKEKKPVLVFTEVDVKKDSASVRYRYDVEGIRGACTLERRDGRWVLKKSRVTER